jgi:hypothetical protein
LDIEAGAVTPVFGGDCSQIVRAPSLRPDECVVAPAPKEAGCDELVERGVAYVGIEQTEAAHLPFRQTQSWHFLELGTNPFNRLSRQFVEDSHRTLRHPAFDAADVTRT